MNKNETNFEKLVRITEILRSENGCNWDKKQTFESMISCIIEETYEVVDAVEKKNFALLKEELGDLLFNVVFYAQMAKEKGHFQIEEISEEIAEKLIRRHPHVFKADSDNSISADEVLVNWNKIKEQEKKNDIVEKSVLGNIPAGLPALLKAEKIQKSASKVGFDWDNVNDVLNKVHEEVNELTKEIKENESVEKIEDEFGDVLFSLVNLSRFLKISPEHALNRTILKFKSRFEFLESEAKSRGKELADMTLSEMDEIWEIAKAQKKD